MMLFRLSTFLVALSLSAVTARAEERCHSLCFEANEECESPCLAEGTEFSDCFNACEQAFSSCSKACNAMNPVKKSDVVEFVEPIDEGRELLFRPMIIPGALGNVTIIVKHDTFPEETGWTFKQTIGGNRLLLAQITGSVVNQSETVTRSVNVTRPGRYRFKILDTEGDGICCFYGRGFFDIFVNGVLKFAASGRFRFQQTVWFDLY
jgi:hypothetical protein